jgi:hypothetical protein
MAKGIEVSEEKRVRAEDDSPQDVLTEDEQLAQQLDIVLQEKEAEPPCSESEEQYKAQISRLLAEIAGLRYENRLLEMRVKNLGVRKEWRPWRRAFERL